MSLDPVSQPFYRRPLVLIGAAAIVAVLVLGTFIAIALLGPKPTSSVDAAATNAPINTPAATPVGTPSAVSAPTPTPTPSHTTVHQAAPAPTKPKPPATKPEPPAKTAPTTPTISNFYAAKTQTCAHPGVTHINAALEWTSTNGTRASLKSVSSYPAVSSKAPDTVITAIDNSGHLNFAVSCDYSKVVYTLTLEYEATGAPQTYATATTQLNTAS